MKREELVELHYITPIANLPSLLRWGIQSHRRASKVDHASISLQEVQDIRANVHVPNGRPLHEYANLYLCARNPMMFKRKEQHREICVLRVDPMVLDSEGAVITDRNAAVKFARFEPASTGLAIVDMSMVFADDWRHPSDPVAYHNHKAMKCAEVLVPDKVPPDKIIGIYVSSSEVVQVVKKIISDRNIEVNASLFFL